VWSWDDIDSIWLPALAIQGKAETKPVAVDGPIAHMDSLCRLVDEKTRSRLLDKMLAAIQRGEQVAFSNITLTKDGVSDGCITARWNDIDEVHEDDQIIYITQHDGSEMQLPIEMATEDICNWHLFYHIVDALTPPPPSEQAVSDVTAQ
jgi:hypothetical protein